VTLISGPTALSAPGVWNSSGKDGSRDARCVMAGLKRATVVIKRRRVRLPARGPLGNEDQKGRRAADRLYGEES